MDTTNAEHVLGDLDAVTDIFPSNEPYIMMNLMKFKPWATYAKTSVSPRPSGTTTGREAYIRYKDMFIKRANEMGVDVSIVILGTAHTQIVAGPQEGESWDIVLLVRYASWTAFRSILYDTKYNDEIKPHRHAALQEFRSFAVTGMADFKQTVLVSNPVSSAVPSCV